MNNQNKCYPYAKHLYGFTLVEVLLAIALFGIISSAIFAVFSRSIALWETILVQDHHKEKTLFFLMSFEKELKNHIDIGSVSFTATDNEISFITLADTIYHVRYVFDKASGHLYRYKSPYPIMPAQTKPVTVLKHIASLTFRYAYPVLPAQNMQKVSGVPCTVEIILSVRDGKTKNSYALSRLITIPVL